MKFIQYVLVAFFPFQCMYAQEMDGATLLEKSIQYHDPNGNWPLFNGAFDIIMEMPGKSNRTSSITINLPEEYFKVVASRDTIITAYTIDKDVCTIALNGKTDLSNAELFSNNLSCERAKMYKNYYTYLYGLPMKLKDEGAHISEKAERKSFKGKAYLVLKVTYDEAVGNDIWYFYFDPETYAMEVYQFFKTDENGNLKPESGEFIMLSDLEVINSIKFPKTRAWYYNKDGSYLATDILRK